MRESGLDPERPEVSSFAAHVVREAGSREIRGILNERRALQMRHTLEVKPKG